MFALMLNAIPSQGVKVVGNQLSLLLAEDVRADSSQQRSTAESVPHEHLSLHTVISYTDRKPSSRLHPIDAKRKLEKTQKEIKRAKLARRASKQQQGARNKLYAGRQTVVASGDQRGDEGEAE
jgi:hypothetical protein